MPGVVTALYDIPHVSQRRSPAIRNITKSIRKSDTRIPPNPSNHRISAITKKTIESGISSPYRALPNQRLRNSAIYIPPS